VVKGGEVSKTLLPCLSISFGTDNSRTSNDPSTYHQCKAKTSTISVLLLWGLMVSLWWHRFGGPTDRLPAWWMALKYALITLSVEDQR